MNSNAQKIIYVSTKTPFLSAVKRAEKLLQLAEKRLMQSATAMGKDGAESGRRRQRHQGSSSNRRKFAPSGGDDQLEFESIAETMEQIRSSNQRSGHASREEIIFKGTGKAIARVLELGSWFQQRAEYTVRIRTGTTHSIDDVQHNRDPVDGKVTLEPDTPMAEDGDTSSKQRLALRDAAGEVLQGTVSETGAALEYSSRIRALNVLEVYVSLR